MSGKMFYDIINYISLFLILITSILLFWVIIKYYKGMRTPPFWIYMLGGFIIIAFRDVLQNAPGVLENSDFNIILSILRLFGYFSVFIGVLELLMSYRSRIKFDKPKES